jgi:hypothetical protein
MFSVRYHGFRILIYFYNIVSFLVRLEAELIHECPWFLGHRCDQPCHELSKIVYLSRENLAGNHQGNGARLESMLWSRSGCLRVNREGHEDQSTQRDKPIPHHRFSRQKVEPPGKSRVERLVAASAESKRRGERFSKVPRAKDFLGPMSSTKIGASLAATRSDPLHALSREASSSVSSLLHLTNRRGFGNFHESPGFHIVDVAVNRNVIGNQWVVSDAHDILDDAHRIVRER